MSHQTGINGKLYYKKVSQLKLRKALRFIFISTVAVFLLLSDFIHLQPTAADFEGFLVPSTYLYLPSTKIQVHYL